MVTYMLLDSNWREDIENGVEENIVGTQRIVTQRETHREITNSKHASKHSELYLW